MGLAMDELDALVRRVDEDRWLASRFAPRAVRERLVAIYALNYEIARTAETVREAAIGEIRLAWWRERLAEIHAGQTPRAHPVLMAYAAANAATVLPLAEWERMIEARGHDLEAEPFRTWSDLDAYLDATAGGVLRLALAACGQSAPTAFTQNAGRAWGHAGLLRAEPHWRARGRNFLPREAEMSKLSARGAEASTLVKATHLPSEAFPAVGYLTLARRYFRALERGQRNLPLLSRQASLLIASLTGRL